MRVHENPRTDSHEIKEHRRMLFLFNHAAMTHVAAIIVSIRKNNQGFAWMIRGFDPAKGIEQRVVQNGCPVSPHLMQAVVEMFLRLGRTMDELHAGAE